MQATLPEAPARAFPSPAQRYAKCVEASKRIRWDIDRDVIRGRKFDFGKKFLPDGLSKAGELIGRAGEHAVSIPLPQIELPRFVFGENPRGKSGKHDGEGGESSDGDAAEGEGTGGAGNQRQGGQQQALRAIRRVWHGIPGAGVGAPRCTRIGDGLPPDYTADRGWRRAGASALWRRRAATRCRPAGCGRDRVRNTGRWPR